MKKGKLANNSIFPFNQSKLETVKKEQIKNNLNKLNRFDFLYENSKIIRKKLETERLIKEFKDKKRMIPEISNKSKLISRNKNLFHERLYIKFKTTIEYEELIEERNLFDNKNKEKNKEYEKLYNKRKEQEISFSFQPILNKKSILIANSLPIKSKERLESLSKIEEIKKKEIIEAKKKKEEMKNKKKIPKLIKENKRCNNLYLKGMELIKKKENLSKEEKKKNENLYKKYSYKPILNKNYNKSNSYDIYTRNKIWKNNINIKTLKLKELNIKKEELNYTYSPIINNSIMDIDTSFIKSNISEYITFINQFNEKKKKKIYEKQQNHNYVSLKKPKQIFINFEEENNLNLLNKSKLSNTINEIEKQRNILGTSNFFTDYKSNLINTTYTDNHTNFQKNFSKSRNQSFTFSDAVKQILKQIN